MSRRRCAALLLLLAACAGCGYRLLGSGGASALPPAVQSIAVLPFDNRTNRPEIEQRVTEEVARELSERSRLVVKTDAGATDAVLVGAVLSYGTTPVQFTDAGRATRVEATVSLQATLRQTADDQILWSQSGLIFKTQFDVPDDTTGFFDRETVALDDIARGAADVLVTSIFEGF
ncbi:MAG: hypothetical protein GY716_12035 [bacterium]|nr:hypothetical protein [bacterium]